MMSFFLCVIDDDGTTTFLFDYYSIYGGCFAATVHDDID